MGIFCHAHFILTYNAAAISAACLRYCRILEAPVALPLRTDLKSSWLEFNGIAWYRVDYTTQREYVLPPPRGRTFVGDGTLEWFTRR